MENIRGFLAAMWAEWWPLMSCAAFTILSVIAARIKRNQKKWIIHGSGILAIAFFGLASYFAWTDEHRAKVAAEQKLLAKENERPKPELVGEIEQTLWVDRDPFNGSLFLLLRVKNIGSMPSVVDGFRLRVDTLGVDLAPTLFPKVIKVMDRGSNKLIAGFHPENDLIERSVIPIPSGSPLVGWLWFDIHGKNLEEMRRTDKRLRFEDILSHEYVIPVPNLTNSQFMYYPGSGNNPIKVDKIPSGSKQP